MKQKVKIFLIVFLILLLSTNFVYGATGEQYREYVVYNKHFFISKFYTDQYKFCIVTSGDQYYLFVVDDMDQFRVIESSGEKIMKLWRNNHWDTYFSVPLTLEEGSSSNYIAVESNKVTSNAGFAFDDILFAPEDVLREDGTVFFQKTPVSQLARVTLIHSLQRLTVTQATTLTKVGLIIFSSFLAIYLIRSKIWLKL